MSAIEFSSGPTDAEQSEVVELARRQLAAEYRVERAEAELDAAKDELRAVRDGLLPAAMSTAGIEELKLTGGYRLTVREEFVCGQLDDVADELKRANRDGQLPRPLEERLAALAWLDDNGYGDLARRLVTVTLGAKSEELASELVELLRRHPAGNQLAIDQRRVVPWNTLSGFARDEVAQGHEPPLATLGVTVLRRSRIARPKNQVEV